MFNADTAVFFLFDPKLVVSMTTEATEYIRDWVWEQSEVQVQTREEKGK